MTRYQRHAYSTRSTGKSAHFLTVIEPFEKEESSMIETVEALSESELRIVLRDGTEQRITVRGLSDSDKPSATFRESRDGKVIAEETG